MFWYIIGGLILVYAGFQIFSDKSELLSSKFLFMFFIILMTTAACMFLSFFGSAIHEELWTNLNTYTVAKVEHIPVYATNGLLVYHSINDTRDVDADSYIFADVEQPYLEKITYSYNSFFIMSWMSTVTKTICYLPEKGI